jgi:alkylation response protein AidB-like acyl-CoA dehydrogenase
VIARDLFEDEHEMFRSSFRSFLDREICPHAAEWEKVGIVDRSAFTSAGRGGFLGMAAPEQFGGGGIDDFRFNVIIAEEIQHADVYSSAVGFTLHNDVCLPYFTDIATTEQQERWLPGICSGELITAVAMTEPSTGSDLAAITSAAHRKDDSYVLSGSKTFITNGINADLVIVAAKTDTTLGARGVSLLVVEREMAGFTRGRNFDKMGQHAQDTAELYFDEVCVPFENRLGEEGQGFGLLMGNLAQERLSIAVMAIAAARKCLQLAVDYSNERRAFGQTIGSFQANRFRLAELWTEVEIGQAFVDRCVRALNGDALSAEEAAMAKWWCTELQGRAADFGVQIHGGAGFMAESPISRAFTDARVTRIYGGTTEIMKEIIGRRLTS